MCSNLRWCSDVLELLCWNGEIVRIAFVIDAHDREIIAWRAVGGKGISGSEVRDLMLGMAEIDPRPTLPQAHHFSPRAKKSRSTVSSPILACRSRISASREPRSIAEYLLHPSHARCFHMLT